MRVFLCTFSTFSCLLGIFRARSIERIYQRNKCVCVCVHVYVRVYVCVCVCVHMYVCVCGGAKFCDRFRQAAAQLQSIMAAFLSCSFLFQVKKSSGIQWLASDLRRSSDSPFGELFRDPQFSLQTGDRWIWTGPDTHSEACLGARQTHPAYIYGISQFLLRSESFFSWLQLTSHICF